jgi:shikimate kinase
MNIYLTGLIGSGKTTLGRGIARRLELPFDDLDQAIGRLAGKPFRKVVEEDGWLAYRSFEYRVCKMYANSTREVFGLGGGTPRYEWNRDILRGTGITILLVADLHVLAERVRDHDRPRVHQGTTLAEDLARMWGEHKESYLGFADIVYSTDQGKSIESEIQELMDILRQEHNIA